MVEGLTRESILAQSSDIDTVRDFKNGSRERDNIQCSWRDYVMGHAIPFLVHYGQDYFTDDYRCTYPKKQYRNDAAVEEFRKKALIDTFENSNVVVPKKKKDGIDNAKLTELTEAYIRNTHSPATDDDDDFQNALIIAVAKAYQSGYRQRDKELRKHE